MGSPTLPRVPKTPPGALFPPPQGVQERVGNRAPGGVFGTRGASGKLRESSAVSDLFQNLGLSAPLAGFLSAFIRSFVLITFLLVSAIFSVGPERKVAARIQDRLGPTRVG